MINLRTTPGHLSMAVWVPLLVLFRLETYKHLSTSYSQALYATLVTSPCLSFTMSPSPALST